MTNSFADLAAGRTLGKRALLLSSFSDAGRPVDNTFINLLELRGPDTNALQVQLTFGQPRAIPVQGTLTLAAARSLVAQQQAGGSLDNLAIERSQGVFQFVYTPLTGVVDWGIGGVSNDSIETDFSNGTCLNLTCSYLRVRCLIDPFLIVLNTPAVRPSDSIYELSAFVGPGFPKRNNAQRTILLTPLSPGGAYTPVVPIPKFANRAMVAVSGNPTAITGWHAVIVFMASPPPLIPPFQTPVFADLAAIVGVYTVIDGTPLQVPIPNGAAYACVFNPNAFDLVQPSLIFDLGV